MSTPGPTHSYPDLTTFKALSFDCYGTLVDYEGSLHRHLAPLHAALPPSHPLSKDPTKLMQRFNETSDALERTNPTLRTDDLLVQSFHALVSSLQAEDPSLITILSVNLPSSAATEWLHMPGRCAPFADTVGGLLKLKRYYERLIILSNVDERNIAASVAAMDPVRFDAVYTAEAIGSYKPSLANFRYLFERAKGEFGVHVERGDLLHVARSLKADHVPAKEVGLRSLWIARGGDGATGEQQGIGGDVEDFEGRVGFEWKFQSIGEFADEVERQFEAKKRG